MLLSLKDINFLKNAQDLSGRAMAYALGSDDPKELAYYNWLIKEMNDMKKDEVKKGISLYWDIPD